MLMILHRFAKPWRLTADHKVGVQFKKNILTLCFPWKLFSNRSLAGTSWQAAPLALPVVAATQPGRPHSPWYISPVSVDALCCEGQSSCTHVIQIIHCRCQDAGWLQNRCKPKTLAGNKSLGEGGGRQTMHSQVSLGHFSVPCLWNRAIKGSYRLVLAVKWVALMKVTIVVVHSCDFSGLLKVLDQSIKEMWHTVS